MNMMKVLMKMIKKKRLKCSFGPLSIYLVSLWSLNVFRANPKTTRVPHLNVFLLNLTEGTKKCNEN